MRGVDASIRKEIAFVAEECIVNYNPSITLYTDSNKKITTWVFRRMVSTNYSYMAPEVTNAPGRWFS